MNSLVNLIAIVLTICLQLTSAATPACLLACTAQIHRDSTCSGLQDIKCMCTKSGSDLQQCFRDLCPNDDAKLATEAFEKVCDEFGVKAQEYTPRSSSSSSSTKTSSKASSSSSTDTRARDAESTTRDSTAATTDGDSTSTASDSDRTSTADDAATSTTQGSGAGKIVPLFALLLLGL